MNNEKEKDLYSPQYDRWLSLTQHDFGNGISINRDCVTLLGRISILTKTNKMADEKITIKGCWASDNYFAGLYFVGISTIQEWLKKLSDCNLITRHTVFNGKNMERYITINYELINTICKPRNPSSYANTNKQRMRDKKDKTYTENSEDTYTENSAYPIPKSQNNLCRDSGIPYAENLEKSKEYSKELSKEISNIEGQEENNMAKSTMVKCRDTGESVARELAFKAPNNWYYSSEEGYNSRLVECCDTKTKLPRNQCYIDNSLGSVRYFSSEKAFHKHSKDVEFKNKCIDFMFELFGVDGENTRIDTRFYKDLEYYNDVGFDLVYKILQGEKNSIDWAMSNKDFKSQYQSIKYIFAIVNNNINKYQKANKEQAKMDADIEASVDRQRSLMYDDIDINAIGRRR